MSNEVVELSGVAEVIREANLNGGAGVWRSCTGCHETNEGAETGHYPFSEVLGCYLGSGCNECGGIGATWEYWSEADLASMSDDARKPTISAWLPEQDRHRLAALGKLAEECNELAARAARCIIHGIDETDPDTGRTNRDELAREMADVQACVHQVEQRLDVPHLPLRAISKSEGFNRWHQLIDEASHAS